MREDARASAPRTAACRSDAANAAPAATPRVIYCGGCNPHIDRTAVAVAVGREGLTARPSATLYLSGCARACASDHQLATGDPDGTVVAGPHVDGVPTPAADIVAAVRHKLRE